MSETIKSIRAKSGLTQAEFAERLGVSKSTVSAWEVGTRRPGLDKIIKISSVFGVPVQKILGVKK